MTIKLNSTFVRHMMLDQDLTARELAALAGIGENTMYRMLSGAVFTSETLGKVAKALKCHPVDLIDADGYPPPHVDTQAAELAFRDD